MSTSKLQKRVDNFLSIHFAQYTIRENNRPDWLVTPEGSRLELDFYIEELETAIEVQGEQHIRYIPHFHGNLQGFEKRKRDDEFKKRICADRGIRLIEVWDEADVINLDSLKPKQYSALASEPISPYAHITKREKWSSKKKKPDLSYWLTPAFDKMVSDIIGVTVKRLLTQNDRLEPKLRLETREVILKEMNGLKREIINNFQLKGDGIGENPGSGRRD